jgi:hypothetical protein
MLPTATPLVKVRWKIIKKIKQGKMPSRAAAACVVITALCSPCAVNIARGTVCFEFDIRKISGIKKSLYVQIKKNTKSTDSEGIERGIIIRPNI